MCAFTFCDKTLYGLQVDYKQLIEKTWSDLVEGDAIISDRQIIEKIRYAAVEYDYTPEGFETLLKNFMRFIRCLLLFRLFDINLARRLYLVER